MINNKVRLYDKQSNVGPESPPVEGSEGTEWMEMVRLQIEFLVDVQPEVCSLALCRSRSVSRAARPTST